MRAIWISLILMVQLWGNPTILERNSWNLISVCQDMNMNEVNMTNIQEIQNQEGKSIYTGEWAEYSNLKKLEAGYGYWVKGNKGATFDSGEANVTLKKPLNRTGWNLMASCEDVDKANINMMGISEIQAQDGHTLYTGENAKFSNLDRLLNGYGYWVKGSKGTLFEARGNLDISIDNNNSNTCSTSIPILDDSNFLDTPPNDNIAYSQKGETVEDIEKAFNNARSNDTTVSKLLKMPSQEKWDSMTIQEKALFLLNAERYDRGIKPFEGISPSVVKVAQDYADLLYNKGKFGHNEDGNPLERLDRISEIKDNREFLSYAENIYATAGSNEYTKNPIAKAIYNWIYKDKDTSWGHRKFCLVHGLKDNSGKKGKEGLIGFGLKQGDKYAVYPNFKSTIIVMNAFDPSSSWNHDSTIELDCVNNNSTENNTTTDENSTNSTENNTTTPIDDNITNSVENNSTIEFINLKNIDIAHKYGIATQGTDSSYQYYQSAYNTIDNDDSTMNHTDGGKDGKNWVQIELPHPTKVSKIVLQNGNSFSSRLTNAKVYISNTPYIGTVDENNLVKTLEATNDEQVIELNPPKSGSYLLIKGEQRDEDDRHIHLKKVEVYGAVPTAPTFKNSDYTFGLKPYSPIGTVVGKLDAIDYEEDSLTYSIKEDVPFKVDNSGQLILTKEINHNLHQSYNFTVEVSDGNSKATTEVEVKLLGKNGVNFDKWLNIDGTTVSSLLKSSHFKDTPDEHRVISSLDFYANKEDHFGLKLYGYLKAPQSGNYTFAIIGDDETKLELNGNTIALKEGWGSYQDWNSASKSKIITLHQGEIYPIVAYLKEEAGAEHVSVAWKRDDESDFTVIPSSDLFTNVLNSESVKPIFKKDNYTFGIKPYSQIGTVIGKLDAIDYQEDSLTYSIKEDVPFKVDNSGQLILTKEINHNLHQSYNFTVEVSDGNSKATTQVEVKLLDKQGVNFDKWLGINGTAVSDFLDDPHSKDAPDEHLVIPNIDLYENKENHFGAKFYGYLQIPQSGNYTFAVIGDDGTELDLDGEKIAYKLGWGSYQDWNNAGKSKSISLHKGEIHPILVYFKEESQTEHVSVAWRRDGESDFTVIPSSNFFTNVLNSESVKPYFENNITEVTIDKWQSISEAILSKKAIDTQNDTLIYTVKDSVPFRVDDNGSIFVTSKLDAKTYNFTLEVSDGVNSITTPIAVNVIDTSIVKDKKREEVSSPALSGYLPNIYNSGDSVSIRINGKEYEATVLDGKWYLDEGTIDSLAQGDYDVTVIINGQEITYSKYFSVDGRGFYTFTKTLTPTDISTLNLTVVNHTERMLSVDEKVRGTSVELKTIDSKVYLVNDSYREIESLIGTYVDSDGNEQFVKLQFNQHILPYSSNELESFANDDSMSIYHTANMFNGQLSFGGEKCDENTDTSTTHYCIPTSSENQETYSSDATGNNEQKMYSIAWAIYNHLYNTVRGFVSFKTWINKSSYGDLNLSEDYQSSPQYIEYSGMDREDFMYNRFFGMIMPNHSTEMRAMRFQYAAEGMAGMPYLGSLTSSKIVGSWASIWEGAIYFEDNTGATSNPFNTIHHEIMHSFGYDHESGMTYGWSFALEKVIPYFYTNNAQPIQNPTTNPVVHAPKYIFKSKRLVDTNQIELKVYKTEDATQNDIIFEIFSATKLLGDDISQNVGDSSNTVVLTYKPKTLRRFFIAIYGSDSLEIMSKIYKF